MNKGTLPIISYFKNQNTPIPLQSALGLYAKLPVITNQQLSQTQKPKLYADILITTSLQPALNAEPKIQRPATFDWKIMNCYGVPIIF